MMIKTGATDEAEFAEKRDSNAETRRDSGPQCTNRLLAVHIVIDTGKERASSTLIECKWAAEHKTPVDFDLISPLRSQHDIST